MEALAGPGVAFPCRTSRHDPCAFALPFAAQRLEELELEEELAVVRSGEQATPRACSRGWLALRKHKP